MNNLFKILAVVALLVSISFSNTLKNKNLYDQNISMAKGAFKIFEFDKMIKNIKVSDAESVEVDFLDSVEKPLQSIKVYTKKLGHGNILITFHDTTSIHIDINITENLESIIEVAKIIGSNLNIKQTKGKIILSGSIKNQKEKDKVLDLFKKAGVNLDTDLVDLATLENPDKMIRVKLYAVEVNNDKGLDLKNNWFVSSKNYMQVKNSDGTYYNEPLDAYGAGYKVDSYRQVTDADGNVSMVPNTWSSIDATDRGLANNQRNGLVNDAIDNLMAQAVSLTGGLTGAANYLGKHFNVGLTLNYLKSQGVANILDETTLLTLENKKAEFHAGGTVYIKMQTTNAQGIPITEVKPIDYGLQLDIKAKNIVNDGFISLDIVTKSTQIDWANQVDGIPNFKEKSIKTNVVIGDQSTIVLGGLVNSQNARDVDKIPVLGDVPVLGFLFTSKSFREGQSELVFFITPEIVDAKTNSQQNLFQQKAGFAKKLDFRFEDEKEKELKEKRAKKVAKANAKKELTSQELHEQRVKEMLGY